MNLWAKSLRQLAMLTVALFFFSCEDENSILGFKNPNQKFSVSFLEIPLESSVVLIDSLVTDNADQRGVALLGEYQDEVTGNVKATSYVQVYAASSTLVPADAVFDSVTLQMRLNFYSYGFTGIRQEKFAIYEVKVPALSTSQRRNYYYNTSFKHEPFPIGDGTVDINYDTLKKYAALASSSQDTILATARLDDDYGLRLFDAAKTSPAGFPEFDRFKYEFSGLTFEPTESAAIIGLNIYSGLSRVTLHYHTPTSTGLTKVYNFGSSSFTNIDIDRAGTELEGQPLYQNFDPASGLRFVQSGAPVVTRLDLSKFYEFADTLDNAIINSAEIVITDVESQEGLNTHGSLGFRLMGENNQFLNYSITADQTAVTGYNVIREGNYYMANSDVSTSSQPVQAFINYSSETKSYSGFMTFFFQSVFNERRDGDAINASRLEYLALYPLRPVTSSSVTRTVFQKDNVKLRIYYTKPTQQINE